MKRKPMMGYLIDTNVFIEIFKDTNVFIKISNQEPKNEDYSPLEDVFEDYPINKRFTTAINLLELYNGARSKGYKEIEKIDLFLKDEKIKIFPITINDSKKALTLMKKYAHRVGLKDKDALVAAISINRNCHLVTIDKDFKKINRAEQLYDEKSRAQKFEELKKDGLKVITLSGYEREIINV
ncbi:tRNA(fMet)-specific endonuclease VapC [uncultured archaeon]|nr:tRNA(fMet)-specific endonuclease VapC [uncultured archaeon]